jgi:hypothetical protein
MIGRPRNIADFPITYVVWSHALPRSRTLVFTRDWNYYRRDLPYNTRPSLTVFCEPIHLLSAYYEARQEALKRYFFHLTTKKPEWLHSEPGKGIPKVNIRLHVKTDIVDFIPLSTGILKQFLALNILLSLYRYCT